MWAFGYLYFATFNESGGSIEAPMVLGYPKTAIYTIPGQMHAVVVLASLPSAGTALSDIPFVLIPSNGSVGAKCSTM